MIKTKPQKILVIQTAYLGDAILSTSIIKPLKEIFPKAEIGILAIPETELIFKYNPYIEKLFLFNKRALVKKVPSFFKVVYQLRREKYDIAISLQTSLTSSLIMILSGIPIRIGFARQKLLTHPMDIKKGLPITKRFLLLLKVLTEREFPVETNLYWDKNTESKAEKNLIEYCSTDRKIVGIAPGSIRATKRWPKEYFAELLKKLEGNNISVFLFGGKEDRALCDEIISKANSRAINMAGELSILESAAMIEKMDLLVTNDSAPMHIANAVKTDVVAIFGPTVKRFGFFPYRQNDKVLEIDLYCRPCSKHGGKRCPEGHFRCMRDITPDRVLNVILSQLEKPLLVKRSN